MAYPDRQLPLEPWFISSDPIRIDRGEINDLPEIGKYTYDTQHYQPGEMAAGLSVVAFRHFADIVSADESLVPTFSSLHAYYLLADRLRRNPHSDPDWQTVATELKPYQDRSPLVVIDKIAQVKAFYDSPKPAQIMTRLAVASGLGILPETLSRKAQLMNEKVAAQDRQRYASRKKKGDLDEFLD